MKRLLVLLAFVPFIGNAQLLTSGKNIIKTNLSSIVMKNYHFTYERAILRNLSVSLSYRTMPTSSVPLNNAIEKYINNNISESQGNVKVADFKMGGYAITPEVRLYLGLGRLKGFYVSGYYRMSKFDVSVPVSYTTTYSANTFSKSTVVSGTVKGNAGGLMIGIQKNLAKFLVLDFWLIGGHYGSSKGDLTATVTESFPGSLSSELSSAKQVLEKTETKPFEFEYTTNPSGATTATKGTINGKSTGPWAGIRGAGICIGVRF